MKIKNEQFSVETSYYTKKQSNNSAIKRQTATMQHKENQNVNNAIFQAQYNTNKQHQGYAKQNNDTA